MVACMMLSACSMPDAETARLQVYYAKMGDQMTTTTQRVVQRNPQKGVPSALAPGNPPASR